MKDTLPIGSARGKRNVHSVAFTDKVNGVNVTVSAAGFFSDPSVNIGLQPDDMLVTVDGVAIDLTPEDDLRLTQRAVEVYEEESRR